MAYREKRIFLQKAYLEPCFEGIFPPIEISIKLLDGSIVTGILEDIIDQIDMESREQESIAMIIDSSGTSKGIFLADIAEMSETKGAAG